MAVEDPVAVVTVAAFLVAAMTVEEVGLTARAMEATKGEVNLDLVGSVVEGDSAGERANIRVFDPKASDHSW